jgi:hypothetical protein
MALINALCGPQGAVGMVALSETHHLSQGARQVHNEQAVRIGHLRPKPDGVPIGAGNGAALSDRGY